MFHAKSQTMTIPDFESYVDQVYFANRPEYIRQGQHAFNSLHGIWPSIADSIRGSDIDPFYLDCRVPNLLMWLAVNCVDGLI